MISLGFIPNTIKEKLEAIKRYSYCPYCDIINKEKNSLRHCYENNSFIAFTPYASRFNYEIWIFPKNHIKTFNDFNDGMYEDLANILKKISQKLESMDFAFNVEYNYSPNNEDLHFHIEVMPRVATWAGFELGFGIEINTVSPETAGKFYRGE
jgi:UDPglucose--hexose-1-phosphate uridylyltransferase